MSRILIGIFAVALLVPVGMTAQQKAPAPAPKPVVKKATPRPAVVPKDAVPAGERRWRWKDPQGKMWIFSQTPFGVTKREEGAVDEKRAHTPESNKLAVSEIVDQGDSLHFISKTPFTENQWTRKKTELTAAEKEAWESWKAAKQAHQAP